VRWWPFRKKKRVMTATELKKVTDFLRKNGKTFDEVYPRRTRRELATEDQYFIGGERVVALSYDSKGINDGYYVDTLTERTQNETQQQNTRIRASTHSRTRLR